MAKLTIANTSEPPTPSSGRTVIWVDSSSKTLMAKDDTGTVTSYGVMSPLTYKGGYDANTNTPDLDTSPSGISKGYTYTITAAGTFFTAAVESGDFLIAEIDNPTVEADWTILNKNIDATGANSFETMSVDNGTNPVASSGADTLTVTSSDSSIEITGNESTDTIDYKWKNKDVVMEPSAVGTVPTTIKLLASQTANGFVITDSADVVLFSVDKDGFLTIPTGSTGAQGLKFGATHGIYTSGTNLFFQINDATKAYVSNAGMVSRSFQALVGTGEGVIGWSGKSGLGLDFIENGRFGLYSNTDLILDVKQASLTCNVQFNIQNMPTSASGLVSGDIWNDGGTLKIV